MAQPEVAAMFVVFGPGRVEGAEIDDFRVVVRVVLAMVAEGEHRFAGVAVPAPVKVSLMATDGGGQAVFRSKNIDRAGFSVIAAEDGGVGAHIRRQGIVARGEAFDHLRKAKAGGEK